KDITVLIPQDDRDAHHHEDYAQQGSSKPHVKEDGHSGQAGGIGFAQLVLQPGRGGELIPVLAARDHVEIDFLGVQEILAGVDHLQNVGLIPVGQFRRTGAGEQPAAAYFVRAGRNVTRLLRFQLDEIAGQALGDHDDEAGVTWVVVPNHHLPPRGDPAFDMNAVRLVRAANHDILHAVRVVPVVHEKAGDARDDQLLVGDAQA